MALKLASKSTQTKVVSPPLPPPRAPFIWTWTCHKCGSEFPLACTRRCLSCSHQLCTPQGRGKRVKTCTTEFDYTGWEIWGAYRRSVAATRTARTNETGKKPAATAVDLSRRQTHGPCRRKRGSGLGAADYDTFATWKLTAENSSRRGWMTQSLVWQPLTETKLAEVSRRKERMYVGGRHDCHFHCDFPSECLHAIRTAWIERRIRPASKHEPPPRQV